MKKTLIDLSLCLGILAFWTWSAYALGPQQSISVYSTSTAAADLVLSQKIFYGASVNWQSADSARYFMLIDGTSLPSNGTIASCSASYVSGCLLWCGWEPLSTDEPGAYTIDFTAHPIAAKFGLIVAESTGAGCGTLTIDGSNDFFYVQAN